MTVHWIRVGRWLLAKTPIHGPRVYRLPTKDEETQMLDTSWAPTDYELWGGHPNEILTDYVGKPPKTDGDLAGLATVPDMLPSEWDYERDGKPNLGFSRTTLPIVRDHYTFTDKELVIRFRQSKGECRVTCGYCESRTKSRDVQKLLRWWKAHACISPYGESTARQAQ